MTMYTTKNLGKIILQLLNDAITIFAAKHNAINS